MANNKVAYVTGGMGGIGTAICQRLHKEGFTVIAGCGPSVSRVAHPDRLARGAPDLAGDFQRDHGHDRDRQHEQAEGPAGHEPGRVNGPEARAEGKGSPRPGPRVEEPTSHEMGWVLGLDTRVGGSMSDQGRGRPDECSPVGREPGARPGTYAGAEGSRPARSGGRKGVPPARATLKMSSARAIHRAATSRPHQCFPRLRGRKCGP